MESQHRCEAVATDCQRDSSEEQTSCQKVAVLHNHIVPVG